MGGGHKPNLLPGEGILLGRDLNLKKLLNILKLANKKLEYLSDNQRNSGLRAVTRKNMEKKARVKIRSSQMGVGGGCQTFSSTALSGMWGSTSGEPVTVAQPPPPNNPGGGVPRSCFNELWLGDMSFMCWDYEHRYLGTHDYVLTKPGKGEWGLASSSVGVRAQGGGDRGPKAHIQDVGADRVRREKGQMTEKDSTMIP